MTQFHVAYIGGESGYERVSPADCLLVVSVCLFFNEVVVVFFCFVDCALVWCILLAVVCSILFVLLSRCWCGMCQTSVGRSSIGMSISVKSSRVAL